MKNKTEALKCIQKLTKILQTQIRLYILPQQIFFQPIKTNVLDFCMHSIFFLLCFALWCCFLYLLMKQLQLKRKEGYQNCTN